MQTSAKALGDKKLDRKIAIGITGECYLWSVRKDGRSYFMGGMNYQGKKGETKNFHVNPNYCLTASIEICDKFFPKQSILTKEI